MLAAETMHIWKVDDAEPRKIVSFTDKKVQVLHRFCDEIIVNPHVDLVSSGRNLTLYLIELIKEHVDISMPKELTRSGLDLNAP